MKVLIPTAGIGSRLGGLTAHYNKALLPIGKRPVVSHIIDWYPVGTEFIITRYREANQNLRTQLTKIIKRAGLEPWPKLFHNLRSTRETELAETYPLHVVCAWIGNSQPIAAKHYLQVTDDHFSQAAGVPTSTLDGRPTQPVQALQNALQHPAATARTASHVEIGPSPKAASCKEIQDVARECANAEIEAMGPPGLEPGTSSLSATRSAD